MVICGITIDQNIYGELRSERVRDSKKIGPNRREILAKFLKRKAEKYEILEFEAEEIDRLRGEGTNMNQIEELGFARVLNRLNPQKAYIDSASANAEKFSDNIRNMLEKNIELIVEHKADEKYLPVSAASIVAKVRRDKRIKELEQSYGKMGSGYPSDERTINFLKTWMREHEDLPDFARKSWKTAQRIKSESQR